MDILRSFTSMLDLKGIKYIRADESVQMVLCSGQHKWKCAVSTTENGFFCIYSRYPWKVPSDRIEKLLSEMNDLNKRLVSGCFMISDGCVMFRYALYVGDPLLFTDIAADHFSSAAAMTDRAWDRIYSALHSAEV